MIVDRSLQLSAPPARVEFESHRPLIYVVISKFEGGGKAPGEWSEKEEGVSGRALVTPESRVRERGHLGPTRQLLWKVGKTSLSEQSFDS